MESFEQAFSRYLAAQDEARRGRVLRVLGAMTKRERQLVKEIAVMAWVRGMRAGGNGAKVPKDSEIIFDAVLACLSFQDLYPTVDRLERIAIRRERRAKKANS